MTANVLTTSVGEPLDVTDGLSRRMLRIFKAQVEDWFDACCHVTGWEDRHLIDHPTQKRLEEHARILEELENVGRWLSLATQSVDFPDRATAELVTMTLQDLKDRRALWHGSLKPKQREEILNAVSMSPELQNFSKPCTKNLPARQRKNGIAPPLLKDC